MSRSVRTHETDRSREENDHLLTAIEMPEQGLAKALLAFLPAYALVGLVAVFSDEGPRSGTPMLIALLAVSTIPPVVFVVPRMQWGLAWIERFGTRRARPASLFRAYADLGVAVVLFTFADYEAALFGALLLGLTSMFVAHFEPTPVVVAHVVFSSAVIITLAVLAWRQDEHDTASIVARAIVVLLVVNGTIGVPRRISSVLQKSFRAQFVHANRDPLTGLLNRRGFEYWSTMLLFGSPSMGFLVIDVDNFKAVNDAHGHDAGDAALRLLARRVEEVVGFRASAVSRSGGEEFAIAVAADDEELTALAEAIRVAVHDSRDPVPITVSVGAATGVARYRLLASPDEKETIARGLTVADTAMYAAKAAGRNRVVTLEIVDTPTP